LIFLFIIESYKRVKNQVRMKFLIQKSERRLIGFV
jgi:hypothetical protein